ncbi:MAG: glutamate-1-semialdehyde 2,1-aminomutase, partial [Polyangia bacterium]|nr:glutamate-1-semialdehyde 2,1-aminomutase [Polyangia bacterium]
MTRTRTLSDKLFARATTLMPGGVSSPVRAFGAVGGHPLYFRRGRGAELFDVDGNAYVDFCMSWGPLILGHWPEAIREEVAAAMGEGLTFGACSPREIACAEAILLGRPAGDLVRFVSSGTEAVMTALRLARGATGRPKILKFEGCYHGHSDGLLVKAGSGLATSGIASSKGVPPAIAGETLVAPLDDDEALEKAFETYGPELAAAVIEPIPANAGLLEQRLVFLQRLRALCAKHGALFVADEVITGFRLTYGSFAESCALCPDLVTFGKIIGGGMPVGALVGRRELMEQLAPLGPVYQAGTLSGNPVAMAAGAATLAALQDGSIYARLEELGAAFDAAIAEARARAGLPWLRSHRVGSILWLYLAEGELPRRSDRVSPEAIARFNGIHGAMLEKGYYPPPSGWEVFFLSAAHTEAQVTGLASALAECL